MPLLESRPAAKHLRLLEVSDDDLSDYSVHTRFPVAGAPGTFTDDALASGAVRNGTEDRTLPPIGIDPYASPTSTPPLSLRDLTYSSPTTQELRDMGKNSREREGTGGLADSERLMEDGSKI